MKNKAKPLSRQKKQGKALPKKINSPKKVNKRKPVTALFWQSTLDAVTDAVCFLDVDQRILHCNRTMTEMFGLTQKEIIGKHCWEIVHGTTKPISKCPTSRAKKSLVRENGEILQGGRWINIVADPILDKKGKIKGMVHTLQDITEHKRAVLSLQESENKYRELVENVGEVIFSVNIQGCITYVSPSVENLTGYSTKAIIGTNISKHIIPEDLPKVLTSINRILVSGRKESLEFRIKIKNGEIRYVVSLTNVILKDGQPAGLTGVITDITERKHFEESLKEAELKFRTIFDSASDGILLAETINKHFISANEKMCRMLGYTKEELLKLNVSDIHPKKSLPYIIDQFEKLVREKIAIAHDIPVTRKDKTVFFADVNSSSIFLEGKQCLIGMFRDVSKRKNMEEALKERDIVFKKLSANVPGMIFLFLRKPDGTYCAPFSTDNASDLFGCSPEDIAGDFSPIARVVHPDDFERLIDSIEHSAKNMSHWQCEFRVQVPGKPLRWLLGNSSPEKQPDGSIIWHGFCTDITERKQAEEALKKSEKLYRTFFNTSRDCVYITSLDGKWIDMNDAAIEFFGYSSRDELMKVSIPDLYFTKEDRTKHINTILEKGFCKDYPVDLRKKNGDVINSLITSTILYNADEQAIGFMGTIKDVTERRQTEKQLLLINKAIESSSDAIAMSDPQGHHFYQNKAFCDLFEYSNAEELQTAGGGPAAFTDKDTASEVFGSILNGRSWQGEAEMISKSGRIFPVQISADAIKDESGKLVGLIGIHTDITERKRTEEALKRSEEDFRSLFEQSLDGILIIDQSGIIMANHAFSVMSGLPVDKIIGKNPLDFIHPDDREIATQRIAQLNSGQQLSDGYVYRGLRTDSSIFWVDLRSQLVEWKGKKVFQTIVRDINERRQADEALRASEEKYRGIFDESITTVYVFDSKKNFIDANQAGLDLLGYSREELMKMSIQDVDTDPVAVLPAHQELYDGGRLINYEHRLRRKDGRIVTVLNNSRPLTDANGKIIGMLSTLIDITERKKAEAEIAVLSNALKLALDPILILDLEGKVINVNEAAKKLFETEDLGVSALDYVAPEDKEKVSVIMQELIMGGVFNVAEFTAITKSGRRVFIEATGNLIVDANGKATGLVVVERDITDRKRMEEALRQEQQFSKSVLDNLPEIFYLFTYPENRLKLSNKQVETLLGFNAEEINGRHVSEWVAPEYRDAILKAIDEVMEKGKNSIEAPLLTKDGQQIPFFLTGARFEVNDQSYFMGIGMDLTERKKAEEKLKQSQLLNEAVINSIPGLLYLYDDTGHLIHWNKQHEELTGYSGEEIKGRYILDWFGGVEPDTSIIKKGISETTTKGYGTAEAHLLTKDGNSIFMSFTGVKLNISGRDHLLGIGTDITERKKAEKELEKYREHLEELVRERTIKLEASNKELEAFSYSASHDLRAPLRSIEGFSQALLEDYRDKLDIQGKDYLTRIKTATRRMADLIEDMLQLSRITRMEMNIEKVNLTLIARSVMSELQKSQPQRHVEIIIADSLEDTADLRLMRIVLDNLLSNAWKFTERQGKAKIEFGLWKTEGSVKTYFIRDNGAGFDMAYSDKLFAPFQRLHADDEFPGTGIGLATVRRIINRHGGKVWAEGEIDKGASFYFSINEK